MPETYEKKFTTAAQFQLLIDAYLLGEYIQDLAFMNAIMDAFVDMKGRDSTGKVSGVWRLRYIWGKTAPGSKLRQLMIDICAHHATSNFPLEDSQGPLPDDFFAKLAVALLKRRVPTHAALVATDYHQHPPKESEKQK